MKTTILPDGSAFSTQIILSKEEIAALPIEERPISHRISSEMYHAVWEAIGAASMCWIPIPSGNFDSGKASKIAMELCFKIAEEVEKK